MNVYKLNEGTALVKAARSSIELYLTSKHFKVSTVSSEIQHINGKHGVFVTLQHYPTMELRGCIGFTSPKTELHTSVLEAAISAAFRDPRFVPVSKAELNELLISVSILSKPEEIKGDMKDRKRSVKIGRDGLIVQYGYYGGLLLPIVAVEQNWGVEEFLEEACTKAGLNKNYWSQPKVKLYKFETQVFKEETPNGRITEQEY